MGFFILSHSLVHRLFRIYAITILQYSHLCMLVLICTRIPFFLTHNFMNNLPTEIVNAINLLIQSPAVQSVYS